MCLMLISGIADTHNKEKKKQKSVFFLKDLA